VRWTFLKRGCAGSLVDAGLPGHYGRLTAMLESIGRSVRDMRAVLLTHVHLDHVGLAERLRQRAAPRSGCTHATVPALAHPLRPPADAKPESSLGRYLLRHPTALRVPVHLARSGAFRTPAITSAS
jgi:glyoxylase-like metal-dependent hydrolase (beta-lactamase superfamily II)